MDDVTLPELTRRVESHERRFNDYVQTALYDRDIREMRSDIAEIKDTVKWGVRLIGALFIGVIVDIIVRVATSGVIP